MRNADVATPDAITDLIHSRRSHRILWNVNASPSEVLTNILPEVRQLQRAASVIGEREPFRIAVAARIEHQLSNRVGGVAAIAQKVIHRCISSDRLILAKSSQQIVEWLLGNIADADRLPQGNKDRVLRLTSIAGIELLLPHIEQSQRLRLAWYFVAKVVRNTTIRIDAVKVRTQALG